jgi:hypothetical protein
MKLHSALLLTILLLCTGLASSIHAQNLPKYVSDGNSLYALCTASSGNTFVDAASEGMCLGYVDGVATTLIALDFIDVPTGVTHGQLQDVAVKYLKDNPATRNQDAAVLTIKAITAAFPKRK